MTVRLSHGHVRRATFVVCRRGWGPGLRCGLIGNASMHGVSGWIPAPRNRLRRVRKVRYCAGSWRVDPALQSAVGLVRPAAAHGETVPRSRRIRWAGIIGVMSACGEEHAMSTADARADGPHAGACAEAETARL